jgi:16S rRNA (guanine527-N7)-methyltransferase
MSAAGKQPEGRYGPEDFARDTGVSRETLQKLTLYQRVLEKWQARINLVGPDTLPDIWRRHFLDSAQLYPHLNGRVLFDLGSGAGFPGLVLALMATGVRHPLDVHLVESDGRKAAFIAEAARETGLARQVTIHATRIEKLPLDRLPRADTVTARALASIEELLGYAVPLLAPGGVCVFLKGARAQAELTAARKSWTMEAASIRSVSDPSGTLLRLAGIARGPTAKL